MLFAAGLVRLLLQAYVLQYRTVRCEMYVLIWFTTDVALAGER